MANGTKKYKRNADWCKAYKAAGRETRNKRRKLRRHLRQQRHENDKCAMTAFQAAGGTDDYLRSLQTA